MDNPYLWDDLPIPGRQLYHGFASGPTVNQLITKIVCAPSAIRTSVIYKTKTLGLLPRPVDLVGYTTSRPSGMKPASADFHQQICRGERQAVLVCRHQI
jgi:hypothetical protein